MINRSGTTFVHRAIEETGAEVAQITRAYAVVREVFGLERAVGRHRGADNVVPTDGAARRLPGDPPADRPRDPLVRRRPLPDHRRRRRDRAVRPDAARARPADHRSWSRGAELADIDAESQRLAGARPAARISPPRLAELLSAFLLLDVVEIANASEHSAAEIAELHFALSDQFYVDEMLTAITQLPRDDRWSTLARAAMRHDVYAALSAITTSVLRTHRRRADRRRAHRGLERRRTPSACERARTTVRDGAGPRHRRPGHAVGRAAGDARPAELSRSAPRSARAARAATGPRPACRAPCVRRPRRRRAPRRCARPRPLGASGAACALRGMRVAAGR